MKYHFALPIIKDSQQEVEKTISNNIKNFSHFEIWVDYVKDLDKEFVIGLLGRLGGKLVIVLRRKKNERKNMSLKQRIQILEQLDKTQALVDLDISSQKKELQYIKEHALKLKTIVSYHNFEETPSDKKLKKIITDMTSHSPTIVKVATMCQTRQDALRLMSFLLELRKRKLRYIIVGMGKKGVSTRILGAMWGNEMVFAPENPEEQSAPGQLTRKQFEAVVKNFHT